MNNKHYGCIKCGNMFHGGQCACGWKLPNRKSIEYKNQGLTEDKRGRPGAWIYMSQQQKDHIKKLWHESPKTSEGAMKEEVSNYWLFQIGKMNAGFEKLLRNKGFGNV